VYPGARPSDGILQGMTKKVRTIRVIDCPRDVSTRSNKTCLPAAGGPVRKLADLN
jgi:hypothetical protein